MLYGLSQKHAKQYTVHELGSLSRHYSVTKFSDISHIKKSTGFAKVTTRRHILAQCEISCKTLCISLISIQALIYRGDTWMCEKSVETWLKKKHFKTFYKSTTGKILLGKRTTLQAFGGKLMYEVIVHIKVFVLWSSELCCQQFVGTYCHHLHGPSEWGQKDNNFTPYSVWLPVHNGMETPQK